MTPETIFSPLSLVVDTAAERDFRIDFDSGRIAGPTDGISALRQAIRLRLLTERGTFPIYSARYGLPFRLFSQLRGEVYFIQIKNYITDTLLRDGRINTVDSFEFSRADDASVHVSFRVLTQESEFREETEI